jgi:hypothetical protein
VPRTVSLVITTASPLGFSITNAFRTVAHDAVAVASDPRAQALVAAGAQAYAPDATSQVMQYTHQVQRQIRKARRFMDQGRVIMVQPGQAPPPGAILVPDNTPPPGDDSEAPGAQLPVENSHMLVYAGVGVGFLFLLLLLKR